MTLTERSTSSVAESIEAKAWARMHLAFIRSANLPGGSVRRFGTATAIAAPSIPIVALNRVIGLGIGEKLTRGMLDEIDHYYREAGCSRWFLEWSPAASSPGSEELLMEYGGQLRDCSVKLIGHVGSMAPFGATPSLTVVEIGAESAAALASIVAPALSVPGAGIPGIVAPIGEEGWHYYLALEDDRPIAGAAMFQDGGAAWFGLSATIPEARNRGAQTALLARRIDHARRAGCGLVTAETRPETRNDANPSLRNMRRAGMTDEYLRPWYRFDCDRVATAEPHA